MEKCTIHPNEVAVATWTIVREARTERMGLCDRCEETLRLRWLEWALTCLNEEAVSRPPLTVKGRENQGDDGAS